jgi:hypothetical protein
MHRKKLFVLMFGNGTYTKIKGTEEKQFTSIFEWLKQIHSKEGVVAFASGTVPYLESALYSPALIPDSGDISHQTTRHTRHYSERAKTKSSCWLKHINTKLDLSLLR